jgi:hypothetical protein
MHKDTRHKIYTGSDCQGGEPYVLFTSCLEIKYGALRLVLVEIRCPARYPTLLYIVQGRVPSRLQGRSSIRITRYKS